MGHPFKRGRETSFKVNARICNPEEEYGNPQTGAFPSQAFRAACIILRVTLEQKPYSRV